MSATNDGWPAFPSDGLRYTNGGFRPGTDSNGMTLRDYFAAKETMPDWDQAIASMPIEFAEQLAGRPMPSTGNYVDVLKWEAELRSALKYIRADAMLAAREKGVK